MTLAKPSFVNVIQRGKQVINGLSRCFALTQKTGSNVRDVSSGPPGNVVVNSNTSLIWVGSQNGNVLKLVGNTAYLDINTIGLTTHGKGTWCSHIRIDSIAGSAIKNIMGFGGAGSFTYPGYLTFDVEDNGATGRLRIVSRVSSNSNSTVHTVRVNTSGIVGGGWKHVAVTSNGSSYKLFINGAQQTTAVISGSNNGHWLNTVGQSSIKMTAGMLRFNGTWVQHNNNGYYDDIRMYNRALTQPEIAMIAAGLG